MFVAFILMAVKFWHHNVLSGNDRKWLGQIGDVIANRDDRVPPIGRYNPGQKILFWVLLASMIVLLVSGIALWRPYFAAVVRHRYHPVRRADARAQRAGADPARSSCTSTRRSG